MARIGSLNILSSGLSIEDFNVKLGAQTLHAVAIGEGPNAPLNWAGPGTTGEILMGITNQDPVFGVLVPGAGIMISIDTGTTPSTITISASGSGGGFSWQTTNTSQAMTPNTGYIVTGTATLTLPASTVGQITEVVGNGARWTITGGTMHLITSFGGTLTSSTGFDAITLVCVAAPTTFVATATQGNIEVS
jgi:hypothetical protein